MPKLNHLHIPNHFEPENVRQIWCVPYEEMVTEAASWAVSHHLQPSAEDSHTILLMLVDVQNTFCLPGFELFMAGCSGTGAMDDDRRPTKNLPA